MLPAHTQELLTAAVDGELTASERRLVDRILHESAEARALHAKLVTDARRLTDLPRITSSSDLAVNVLNIINERCITPTPLPVSRRKRNRFAETMLPFTSMITAAVVLIAVSLGSYVYFVASARHHANQQNSQAKNPGSSNMIDGDAGSAAKQVIPPLEELRVEIGPPPREVEQTMVASRNTPPEILPEPRIFGPENIPASPVQPENEPFQVVKIRLSLLLPLRELDQPYPRQKLREELKQDDVVRLDLFAKDCHRAADLLQAALKSQGHHLLIDGMIPERLKKKQRTEFVFFTECMSAEEIALLLEHLGAEDRKREAKKSGEGLFDKFMLAPFLAADSIDLAKLLGIPASHLKLPKMKATGSIDPLKPLESSTVNHLATSLTKGGNSRSNEKTTLVLPYGGVRSNPQTSREIKTFLEKRGERKPGAVPMMLVLRSIS